MKGAQRVLHIRCGDDIRDKLVAAGIEGDYLSFADPGAMSGFDSIPLIYLVLTSTIRL